MKTSLGWTVMGPSKPASKQVQNRKVNFITDQSSDQEIGKMFCDAFQDAWDDKGSISTEDRKAIQMLEESIKLVEGHYQVGLPWRSSDLKLPNNKALAEHRTRNLKKRLQNNEDLRCKYKDVIEGYLKQGYAEQVTDEELKQDTYKQRIWYLPHHPVTSPHKPDKTRVVFDCAAKFASISLNIQLLQGPDNTNNLAGVVIRFRKEPVAVLGDIESMFHQVRCKPEDCDALRFLWWPDGNLDADLKTYRMLVHPFSATSSRPFVPHFA